MPRARRSVLRGKVGRLAEATRVNTQPPVPAEEQSGRPVTEPNGASRVPLDVFLGNEFANLSRSLKSMLCRRGHSPEDADDLIQDTCLRVLMKASLKCEFRSPQAYLRRAVLYASYTRMREAAGRRRRFGRQVSADLEQVMMDALAESERQELAEAVQDAIGRLPPELQTVLNLFAGGKSHLQIGEIMQVSDQTSRRLWNKGIERLRADLRDWF